VYSNKLECYFYMRQYVLKCCNQYPEFVSRIICKKQILHAHTFYCSISRQWRCFQRINCALLKTCWWRWLCHWKYSTQNTVLVGWYDFNTEKAVLYSRSGAS